MTNTTWMSFEDYIKSRKAEWVGKKVKYKGQPATVVDVDANGALLLDIPQQFTDTIAVDVYMLDKE